MVSSPQLSPDASSIAFVVTVPQGDEYRNTVWVVDSSDGSPLRYFSEGDPANPRWSPDGSQMLFTSRRDMAEADKGAGLWVAQPCGESRHVCRVRGGVMSPSWDPSGSRVFFISNVGDEDTDVRLIDRIPIWYNGEGWTYYKSKQLHSVDLDSGFVTQLTHGEPDVQCFSVSEKGDKLVYAKSGDPLRPNESDLIVLDLASGLERRILCGYSISSLCWSPVGNLVAFMGHDNSHGYPTHWGIYLVDDEGENIVNLTQSLDRGTSRRHYYDVRSPRTGMASHVWEGDWIYFPLSEGPRFNLYRVNTEQNLEQVIVGEFSLEEFSVSNDAVAYTRVTTTEPAEVWVKTDQTRKITRFNDALLETLNLSMAVSFSVTQRDGAQLEGWVLKPYGWHEGVMYPVVLDIHGGPRSKFGSSLMFEHQLFASEGYGVVYINIRGSDGYSQGFADIRGQWGTWDYEDLMLGVEAALQEFTWMDPERLGVTGLSYGGFMTNWVITHTDRFKAAISQNSISNWVSFFGTSDIGFHFTPDQICESPWSNRDDYVEKSPLTYAGDVTSPVLLIHSWNDYRCWVDQSIQFFTALKYLGKVAELALFMEGEHSFRSSARLSIRRKRLELMVDWFNMYLKDSKHLAASSL